MQGSKTKPKIWVDADACPKKVKQILYRAAIRTGHHTTLVSNQFHQVPASEFIHTIQVSGGFDIADDTIIQRLNKHDLVITSDIPLSARAIKKGALVLTPRGMLLNDDNISEVLTIRNFKEELRGAGVDTGGPNAMQMKDREIFANQLDRILNESTGK